MKRGFWITLCLILGVIILFSAYCNSSPRREPLNAELAPMQRNLIWQRDEKVWKEKTNISTEASYDKTEGGILIRLEGNNPDILLVKFSEPQEFYKYDGKTNLITPVSETEWQGGKEELSCRKRYYPSTSKEFLTEKNSEDEGTAIYTLKPYQKLETHGRYAQSAMESPHKNLAVILSADGPESRATPGFIFGGQSAQPRGWRYAQILSLADNTYITPPLGLIGLSEFPQFDFCWADNEKFVLAYESSGSSMRQVEMDFHVIKTNR